MNGTTEKSKELLSNVYDRLQKLTIQSTASNINIISSCLNEIQMVYNLLDTVEQQIGKEGDNGSVSDNE